MVPPSSLAWGSQTIDAAPTKNETDIDGRHPVKDVLGYSEAADRMCRAV
jgi:hypothetical protein